MSKTTRSFTKQKIAGAKPSNALSSKLAPSKSAMQKLQQEPKWNIRDYKPNVAISDDELQAAKRIFFELDRDSSGSIDQEELAYMLRSLGQNPSEEELKQLIVSRCLLRLARRVIFTCDSSFTLRVQASVDDDDKDGKIQLREFIQLYTQGVNGHSKSSYEDVKDAYRALGGSTDPKAPKHVSKDFCRQALIEGYELDVDVDTLFEVPSYQSELTLEDFSKLITLGASQEASH